MPLASLVAAASIALLLGSCGGAGAAAAPRPCAGITASVERAVARRTYDQAAAGRNVVSSMRRLARSRALGRAVANGDRAATRAALRPLLRHQIKRIVVTRGPHVLARFGGQPALAPVHGLIRSGGAPVGRYTLSVSGDAAIAGFVHALTGMRIVMDVHGHRVAGSAGGGAEHLIGALHGTAFPSGALRIALLAPRAPSGQCTVTGAYGAIAQRLFRTEARSAATARVLRIVARDRGVLEAVEHHDAALLRARIVHFFRNRTLHVVRIRAVDARGALVNDVGGPYVLAPASRALRDHGRDVGRVTLAIQDDTGYIKLLHRVTGGVVILRTAHGVVPGSNRRAAGRRYDSFRFTARAFPSGPLRVSLLLPA